MISLSAEQLDLWMAGFLFPLVRILGMFAAAPVLSNRAFPARIRLGLGAMMTFALLPTLPPSGLAAILLSHASMFSGVILLTVYHARAVSTHA